MNDIRVETLLIAASQTQPAASSAFVNDTMQRIRRLPRPVVAGSWFNNFTSLRFRRPQFALVVAAIAITVSLVGFSGYAYAIGSDPLSLIKRIIEGDKVKVEYQGRQFEHGVAQTYSDAAVTAFAELNTVEGLAFAANNAGAIPKNGVEYLGVPYGYSAPYVYPTLGTITHVTDASIIIQQQYVLGDKTNASHDMQHTITIPRSAELEFFKEATPAAIGPNDVGRLVQLRQSQAVKHHIGSPQKAEIVTRYFVFALQHSLADFKEADKATTNPENTKQLSTSGLIERNFGKLDDRCVNNGADLCNPAIWSNDGQSLYGKFETSNRDAIPFGEGVGPGKAQPNLMLRNVYGVLTTIMPETIIIKGSSGSEWTLHFTAAQRASFKASWGSELKVGDKIGGSILQGLEELDNRTVAGDHIYSLMRIKS